LPRHVQVAALISIFWRLASGSATVAAAPWAQRIRSPLIMLSRGRLRVSASTGESALQVGHRGVALSASRMHSAQKTWPSPHPEGIMGVAKSIIQIEQVM